MTDNDDFTTIINRYFQNDYRERGKIKWNGYFLSDHTSSLTKEGIQRNAITKKLPAVHTFCQYFPDLQLISFLTPPKNIS